MNINELKDGDIFIYDVSGIEYLVQKSGNNSRCINIQINRLINQLYKEGNFTSLLSSIKIKEATPEQKHWLNVCIAADKFISYEEVMKTFSTERPVRERITSSKVEEEFVLPKNWHIKTNPEIEEVLVKYRGNVYNARNTSGRQIVLRKGGWTDTRQIYWDFESSVKNNSTELTFEQFKKYVLKEEEVSNILKKEGDIILEVQNEEGGVFILGDTVKSSNRPKVDTIRSFRSTDHGIFAITNNFPKNGISINKIELHVELPKKEFILPENWYIQITNENRERFINWWAAQNNAPRGLMFSVGAYYGKIARNNSYNGYYSSKVLPIVKDFNDTVEITYEQFKEHVLGEKPQLVIANGHVQQRELATRGINSVVVQSEVDEETLLEKAKRLYPIGTRFRNGNIIGRRSTNEVVTILNHETFMHQGAKIFVERQSVDIPSQWTLYNGEWAEIIS